MTAYGACRPECRHAFARLKKHMVIKHFISFWTSRGINLRGRVTISRCGARSERETVLANLSETAGVRSQDRT